MLSFISQLWDARTVKHGIRNQEQTTEALSITRWSATAHLFTWKIKTSAVTVNFWKGGLSICQEKGCGTSAQVRPKKRWIQFEIVGLVLGTSKKMFLD